MLNKRNKKRNDGGNSGSESTIPNPFHLGRGSLGASQANRFGRPSNLFA
ncbi:hypothetical protein bcgnr5414_25940 [Bacillus cereus]